MSTVRTVTITYTTGRRDRTTYGTAITDQTAAVAYLGAIVHTTTPITELVIEMHDGSIRRSRP